MITWSILFTPFIWDLSIYWNDISRALLNVAIQTIDNHLTSATSKEFKPKKLTAAYKEIKNVNRTINVLRPSNFNRNLQQFQLLWPNKRSQFIMLATSHNYPINLPAFINVNNFDSI